MAVYDNWLRELRDFKASIDKELAEIRRCKNEMQEIKKQLVTQFGEGNYFRDEHRIIISAPEIIIGDVMQDGTLNNTGTSTVIIRSNNIQQEGVGSDHSPGVIVNKATEIKNICADPGIDGKEAVVSSHSRYSVLAEGITMQSESTGGTFAEVPAAGRGEIRLKADEHISLEAQAPLTDRHKKVVALLKRKQEEKQQLQNAGAPDLTKLEINFNTYFNGLAAVPLDKKDDVNKQMAAFFKTRHTMMGNDLKAFIENTSQLAEVNRQIKTLNSEKKFIDLMMYKKKMKKKTGAGISIIAENTNVWSLDADKNVCESPGAGLSIIGKNVNITSLGNKDGILYGSEFNVNTHKIHLSTANRKAGNAEGQIEMPAEGKVIINSKDITLETVDRTSCPPGETPIGGDLSKEKSLPVDGSIKLRSQYVCVDSRSVEGGANGEFGVASKIVKIEGTNSEDRGGAPQVDKESLLEINVGKTKVTATDNITLNSSKNLLLSGTKTVEIQQNKGYGLLQFDSERALLYSETFHSKCKKNILGKVEVDTLDASKVEASNLRVTRYFKTPNSSEGKPGGAAPTSAEHAKLLLKISELEKQVDDIKNKEKEARKKEQERLKKEEKERKEKAEKERREKEKKEWEENPLWMYDEEKGVLLPKTPFCYLADEELPAPDGAGKAPDPNGEKNSKPNK